jgi:hypothetical protein
MKLRKAIGTYEKNLRKYLHGAAVNYVLARGLSLRRGKKAEAAELLETATAELEEAASCSQEASMTKHEMYQEKGKAVLDAIKGKSPKPGYSIDGIAGVEFHDRYSALGVPPPDPATMCREGCEGLGFYPTRDKSRWPPGATPDEIGFVFIECPACHGTGKAP